MECGFPFGCIGDSEEIVHLTVTIGRRDRVWLVSPQTEIQAFVRVIDVAVQDERVDAIEVRDFPIRGAVRGGLVALAFRSVGAVEALLGEDDAARFAFKKQLGLLQMAREVFEILERDAR